MLRPRIASKTGPPARHKKRILPEQNSPRKTNADSPEEFTSFHPPNLGPFGIDMLTGEACSLMYRLLCDLTAQGKRTVERCLGVTITSENWNTGASDDPHVASIMVTPEMLVPLAVFALLDAGCRECWVIGGAVVGIEDDDTAEAVDCLLAIKDAPKRRFAYHSPHRDRNQHQMSGRVT